MVTHSCLYECTVMHRRKEKIDSTFSYKYFMFYLDLDELDTVAKQLSVFSRNKFNLFAFRDRDHIHYDSASVKENVLKYLSGQGVKKEEVRRIQLLTNVATVGYNFNPASFYFCFDKDNLPLCVVPEVGNTFGELKPFFIGKENFGEDLFRRSVQKLFYVSPFLNHDLVFDFRLAIPGEALNIKIDDYKGDERVFITSLKGTRKALTDLNLLLYALKYPFVTFKVITAIHWQALKLIIKKIPYLKKDEYIELQKGAIKKWKN